jgi:hypothetical protein
MPGVVCKAQNNTEPINEPINEALNLLKVSDSQQVKIYSLMGEALNEALNEPINELDEPLNEPINYFPHFLGNPERLAHRATYISSVPHFCSAPFFFHLFISAIFVP